MQQTIESTSPLAVTCKARLNQLCERMLHLLSFVPDDKLNWSPSPTAKSALQIVTHCCVTNPNFVAIITGTLSEPIPDPQTFLGQLDVDAAKITTREAAIGALVSSTEALCNAIGTIGESQLATNPKSPFGELPMGFWLNVTHEHMAGHVGQLEYIQTIWGDLDNHMG